MMLLGELSIPLVPSTWMKPKPPIIILSNQKPLEIRNVLNRGMEISKEENLRAKAKS